MWNNQVFQRWNKVAFCPTSKLDQNLQVPYEVFCNVNWRTICLKVSHLLYSMCSHHPFPCTLSAICSSCRTLIVDAPATGAIERHLEDQVMKLAAFVSTPKSLSRQLCPPHTSAHYRLSVGSAFSIPSSSSQEEQISMYLPSGKHCLGCPRKNL